MVYSPPAQPATHIAHVKLQQGGAPLGPRPKRRARLCGPVRREVEEQLLDLVDIELLEAQARPRHTICQQEAPLAGSGKEGFASPMHAPAKVMGRASTRLSLMPAKVSVWGGKRGKRYGSRSTLARASIRRGKRAGDKRPHRLGARLLHGLLHKVCLPANTPKHQHHHHPYPPPQG